MDLLLSGVRFQRPSKEAPLGARSRTWVRRLFFIAPLATPKRTLEGPKSAVPITKVHQVAKQVAHGILAPCIVFWRYDFIIAFARVARSSFSPLGSGGSARLSFFFVFLSWR